MCEYLMYVDGKGSLLCELGIASPLCRFTTHIGNKNTSRRIMYLTRGCLVGEITQET